MPRKLIGRATLGALLFLMIAGIGFQIWQKEPCDTKQWLLSHLGALSKEGGAPIPHKKACRDETDEYQREICETKEEAERNAIRATLQHLDEEASKKSPDTIEKILRCLQRKIQ